MPDPPDNTDLQQTAVEVMALMTLPDRDDREKLSNLLRKPVMGVVGQTLADLIDKERRQ